MSELSPLCHFIQALDLPNCRGIALTLLSYLSKDQITTISKAYSKSSTQNYFISLVQNFHFINSYLNCADKSLYFTFYCEEEFQNKQIQKIATITQSKSNQFLTYSKKINRIMSTLEAGVPSISDQMDILTNLIVNPDLPIPKLRRETQGMYCNSPFQLFLVDCTYRSEPEQYSCFEKLHQSLSIQKEQEFLKQFICILKEKHINGSQQLLKIIKVRYTPYQINSDNFEEFFINKNQLHNFIVSLFAFTDVMIEAIHDYVAQISDPLERLVELLLRYSIYRNYILGVQEYLSFVFKMYNNIYHESIQESSGKPKYNFWRPALTKWYLKMNYLHSQSIETYMYCLAKIRSSNLKTAIKDQFHANELHFGYNFTHFNKVYNLLDSNNYEYKLASKIFNGQLNSSTQTGSFFDSHPENYEIIVIEFNEYMIDLSVNEQTVHWCSHSDHQLQQPYLDYEQKFFSMNEQYVESLINLGFEKDDLKNLLNTDVQCLSMLQVKNRTIKKIGASINTKLGLAPQKQLTFDFDDTDRKLQFFNKKAFILAKVELNQRPFYSISPQCSAADIIGMIDTNDSENGNQDGDAYQYRSQASENPNITNRHNFMFQDLEQQPEKSHEGKEVKSTKLFLQDYRSPQRRIKSATQPLIHFDKARYAFS